jgi:rhodanese-related sulfurtransferase
LDRVGNVPGTKHVEWFRDVDRFQNLRLINEPKSKVGKEVILFLYRRGVRSVAAAKAATQEGFSKETVGGSLLRGSPNKSPA